MQIGIQTEEVQTLKEKQHELFTNTNNMCNRILGQQEIMNKEMIDLRSDRECYDIWAHQQLNPNLVEMPVTKLVRLIYDICDKKRPAFLGCLKSDHEAGSSSQAAPPATPTAAPTSAATVTLAPAPAPAPQHAQDDYYPEQFFQK
ncbi:hypothetical protein PIB30_062600 [Stylosanthes scabra]|uniref:Uncharacterized protein n=1 Tax=Stylosanthes scabra TaxID=79078 RepID=A0ABU6WKZ8_9FABA|nr:hypothetical protein [Stylosanthes scabra]